MQNLPAHCDVQKGLETLRAAVLRPSTLTNSAPAVAHGPTRVVGHSLDSQNPLVALTTTTDAPGSSPPVEFVMTL
jgi:hypothetical protein